MSFKPVDSVSLVKKVVVKNELGLHTRPATVIAKIVHRAKGEVLFTHKQETINAKSILSILMLAARKNSRITITVRGEDAEEIMMQLTSAFEGGFGE